MSLEKVVRPYQLRQNSPPIRLEVASAVDPQPVILRIGRSGGGGSGKILNGSYSYSASFYLQKTAVEKKQA